MLLNFMQIVTVSVLAAGPGPNPFSLFGNASIVNDGPRRLDTSVQLVADTEDDTPYAGINFTPPRLQGSSPILADIGVLSALYRVTHGGIGGGSPRFQIGLDEDGDGDVDGNVFVYIGDQPNFTAEPGGWTSTGNLINSTDLRYDTSQISGTFYDTHENAVELAGDSAVLSVSFVVDAGWFFEDGVQTVLVRELQVGPYRYVSPPRR